MTGRVTVPVQSRQGQYDHLWITDADQVRDFGAGFSSAARVDAPVFDGQRLGEPATAVSPCVGSDLTVALTWVSAASTWVRLKPGGVRAEIEPGVRAATRPRRGDTVAPQLGQLTTGRFRESRRFIARQLALAAGASCCVFVAAVPTYGWLPLVLALFPLMGIVGALTEQPHHGVGPYIAGHLSWFLALGIIGARCGGAHSPLLPFLVPSALGLYSRLAPKLAIRCSVASWALTMVPVLIHDWAGFRHAPLLILTCTASLVGLGATAFTMSATEIEQREQATIDPLTGLLNRRGLADRLVEIRDQALVLQDNTPLALIACDIDHFKSINDAYGHGRGDAVLRQIADILRQELRRFELVYRTGGEEFLIVLPGYDATRATALADTMREAVEQCRPTGLEVTMSFGVAAGRAADVDLDALTDHADKALYRAKETGRNKVVTVGPITVAPGTVGSGTS